LSMALSDAERQLISTAATTADPTRRRQAVAVVLNKRDRDQADAKACLGQSFLAVTQPSFHLIPRGQAMANQHDFTVAYERLARATENFRKTDAATLTSALIDTPASLSALRMIAGLTHNELAVAIKLVVPTSRTTGDTLKRFERTNPPRGAPKPARIALVANIVAALQAVLDRAILTVPVDAQANFHSKLDREDTRAGWDTVSAAAAQGVPYSALLYQRYVGGQWRQVQDAYSEVKGDNVLEIPLATLLGAAGVPFHRSPPTATGAAQTARRYGIEPGPDFVIPDDVPAVVIESKVAEDGGTARDKASRIKNLADAGRRAGLVVCALIDGKGWSERAAALVDVVIATEGRTYTLSTLNHILDIAEIAGLRGTRQRPDGEPRELAAAEEPAG
jgi:hypothetical protein